MAKNIKRIGEALGAEIVAEVPPVGGGAFGAAKLGQIVAELQSKLEPGQGKRPGRPTDPNWDRASKVPMSRETAMKLAKIARNASKAGRRVSPMQVAAKLLESAVASV